MGKGSPNFPTFEWTGHPFVDAGLIAILLLSKKSRPQDLTWDDIQKAVEFASELYARKEWSSGYIHAMVLPNSGILMANPSMSKNRTSEKIKENLLSLLKEKEDKSAPMCEICGRRHARSKPVYRSDFPLVGTGGVPNYFPSGKDGANICSHCLFLAQFMPLIAYRMQRLLIIHTNPPEFMLRFHEEALNDVRKTQLASNARGFRRPENFLFEKLMEIGRDLELGKLDGVSITLYYFVSNNQGQEIDIIYIPNPVLRFIAFAGPEFRKIANMGWAKGCTRRRSEEEVVRECRNEVYRRLLENESILPYFVDVQNRRVNSSWRLLEFYCLEVLSLEKDALEFVRDVADRIVETLEKLPDNKLARRVRELERADKLYQFEAFFIRIEKDRQELGIPKALITFDEFATLLTSYGEDLNVSWRTVKHLILFRIYEKLHDKLMKVKEEEKEVEEE
ncbi:CRISPR-associated protein Cst1 [Pyrococcus kukulkanii]|uniref:CRISPR-associated protein Cst1 n=1 Tax=Pyrococcus kukulkanii TaxID=1609559 RepID=A0A127BCA6_9EURY|nr:CRISPR-associated protein Cst1 [Pyrococcus kukulkanii]